jgi:cell division protein FtsA
MANVENHENPRKNADDNKTGKTPAQIIAEKSASKRKPSQGKTTNIPQSNKTDSGSAVKSDKNKSSDLDPKELPVNNKNNSSANNRSNKNKTSEKSSKRNRKIVPQGADTIFSLDIGTRTVVGILMKINEDGVFEVLASTSIPHTQRAMMDGQIEDIKQVVKVVKAVKARLEELSGVHLTKVAIAAAGRALKTSRISVEFNIETLDILTEDNIKSFEIEAVMKAQSEFDGGSEKSSFYCVGHTVVAYELDGYKIKTLAGHRGKRAFIDLIAAFLPSGVVESLYAVTDACELEVVSLTLEPIAAMHVIIPPEVRLINIALVDIGAGTSDIAISRNGSIVAYAMATIAGDEITEEIIRTYLVSFDVAEEMKLTSGKDITYRDILGYEHTVESKNFFESIFPAAGNLADTIAAAIVSANGTPPAAVFLIGGGSQLPGLTDMVAERLDMPKDRVAIGGRTNFRNISLQNIAKGSIAIDGPEYVTPIGIGLAAGMSGGYDFSVITLNGKKKRLFDTKILTVLDMLMLEGFKSSQILGKTGRNLNYTFNGEKKVITGNPGRPSELTLNGEPASINTTLKQGDEVVFVPASDGISASARIYEVTDGVDIDVLTLDGTTYPFGRICNVNGKYVTPDYQIKNYDIITMTEVRTLFDLTETLPFDTYTFDFYIGGLKLNFDYELRAGDTIVTTPKMLRHTPHSPQPPKPSNSKMLSAQINKTDASNDVTVTNSKESVENDGNINENSKEIVANDGKIATDSKASLTKEQNAFALNALIEVAKAAVGEVEGEVPAAEVKETEPVNTTAETTDESKEDNTRIVEENTADETVVLDSIPMRVAVSDDGSDGFWLYLNGQKITLEPNTNDTPHEFVELMSLANLDLDNPPPSRNMQITLNGKTVSFIDTLRIGDDAVIKWADK